MLSFFRQLGKNLSGRCRRKAKWERSLILWSTPQYLKAMDIEPIVTLYHDDMPVDLALKYNEFRIPCGWFVLWNTLRLSWNAISIRSPIGFPNQNQSDKSRTSSIGVIKDTVEDVEVNGRESIINCRLSENQRDRKNDQCGLSLWCYARGFLCQSHDL